MLQHLKAIHRALHSTGVSELASTRTICGLRLSRRLIQRPISSYRERYWPHSFSTIFVRMSHSGLDEHTSLLLQNAYPHVSQSEFDAAKMSTTLFSDVQVSRLHPRLGRQLTCPVHAFGKDRDRAMDSDGVQHWLFIRRRSQDC